MWVCVLNSIKNCFAQLCLSANLGLIWASTLRHVKPQRGRLLLEKNLYRFAILQLELANHIAKLSSSEQLFHFHHLSDLSSWIFKSNWHPFSRASTCSFELRARALPFFLNRDSSNGYTMPTSHAPSSKQIWECISRIRTTSLNAITMLFFGTPKSRTPSQNPIFPTKPKPSKHSQDSFPHFRSTLTVKCRRRCGPFPSLPLSLNISLSPYPAAQDA